jgi:DNA repair protein Rad10
VLYHHHGRVVVGSSIDVYRSCTTCELVSKRRSVCSECSSGGVSGCPCRRPPSDAQRNHRQHTAGASLKGKKNVYGFSDLCLERKPDHAVYSGCSLGVRGHCARLSSRDYNRGAVSQVSSTLKNIAVIFFLSLICFGADSIRYHRLHPEYVHTRIQQLGQTYLLRVLLVQCDVEDHQDTIKELTKVRYFSYSFFKCGGQSLNSVLSSWRSSTISRSWWRGRSYAHFRLI